uniref:Glycosyltransferase family 9 protein n=1 Tax=Candidatus Desulfatibia profunda TaxID=2841695 RepID=A0A8J6NQ67_9BACT|nr:glycosyltransferase family 9 protein [Candidatus Desulfatibia profunda]
MSNKKILIIHLSRLGDMMQSLPVVKLLKEDYPESEITYVGIGDFCVPLKNIPWIDNLITIPSHDIKGVSTEDVDIDIEAFDRLFRKTPELTAHYDVLINMTHNRGSSYLSKRIKADEKRGRMFSKENEIVMMGNWAKYLFAIAGNRNDNLLNLVDLYTGMVGVQNRPVMYYLPTNPEIDRQCLSRLKEHGFDSGRLAVGFQLGASKSLRTWPPEYFLRLGEFLDRQLKAQIILFGSEQERALADQFHKSAHFTFIDLIGRTTLADLPSFLKYINVLVSNDTGPMHIAAAVGTKAVGIFMGTAYFRITGPYGAGHVAVQSNYSCAPCLDSTTCAQPLCRKSISPDVVLQGVKLALGLEAGSIAGSNGASLYISDFDRNGTMVYKRLDEKKDHFLPWLRSFHDARACISQSIWNEWLGLKPNSDMPQISGDDDEIAEILQDYKHACLSYGKLYAQGKKACQNIISEFRKAKPRLEFIQDMIAQIEQVEQEIKNLENPLAILKEIHELYSAETEYCNFPRLAHEFMNKYGELDKIIDGFESRLTHISHTICK